MSGTQDRSVSGGEEISSQPLPGIDPHSLVDISKNNLATVQYIYQDIKSKLQCLFCSVVVTP
jgi:hypothetical protein